MPASRPHNQPALEAQALSKLTLRDVDLEIAPGERVAVIGPSGSGKSVLLACLLGLLRPVSGEATVVGEPVDGQPVRADGLGVAFQQPGLFDGRSIAENLALAGENGLSQDDARKLLQRVGLESVSPEAPPGTLSGGQKKRVALARALLRGDRLLVLDEPTSGLDPESAQQVVALLQEATGSGASLLLITHNYEVALALCDRVLLLTEGRLQDVTPGSELRTAEAVGRLRDALSACEEAEGRADERRAPRWGFGAVLLGFLRRSVLLTGAIMAMLGVLLVVQSAGLGFIDMSRYVPEVVVMSVFRELAPLVVGLLLASRIGAAVSSEVAGMSYTAQLDSMRVLGISRTRTLVLPYAGAAMLAFPVNILLGAFAAVGAGGWIARFPWSDLSIGTNRFFYLAQDALEPALIGACLLKGACMGASVALISYYLSAQAIRSAPQLGRAVTRSVVAGSVAVVLIDFVFSWIFFA